MPKRTKREEKEKRGPGKPPNPHKCPRPNCRWGGMGGTIHQRRTRQVKNGKPYIVKFWVNTHHIMENGRPVTRDCYLGVNFDSSKILSSRAKFVEKSLKFP